MQRADHGGGAVPEGTPVDDETANGDGGLDRLSHRTLLDSNFHLGQTRKEDYIRLTRRIVQQDRQFFQIKLEAVFNKVFGVDGRSGVLLVADGGVEFVLLTGRHLSVEALDHVLREPFRASVRWSRFGTEPAAKPAFLGCGFVFYSLLVADSLHLRG